MLMAAAACLGSWWAAPLPLWIGGCAGLAALAARRPAMLVLGTFLLAAGLGHRAEAGLGAPAPGPFEGVVTLVSDPRETPWGSRADVSFGGKRYEVQAGGGAAGTLGLSLAGERLLVHGRVSRPPPGAAWLKPRHVIGRVTADTIERHDAGAAPWRAANRFRRLLQRGAEVMDEPARSLYGGFVLGDDSGQTAEIVDDFRASGLTHLLVVSGSNVAYVLVLASPLTNRLGPRARWAATFGVVAAFALVTRFEPSILRASAMAAVAVTVTLAGRPATSLRILGLAVTALVLIDPLLVHSVAFQLSVAASLGIVLLSRPIAAALAGPAVVRSALAVTLAAQVAVAPVLVPRFGGMPVVAVFANLVAVPVAGLVTTWGLPAGVLAGLAGPGVGRWLHLPTELAIDWVAATASTAARVPLGEVSVRELLVVVLAGAAAVLGSLRGWAPAIHRGALMVVVVALLAPAVSLRSAPFHAEPLAGVHLYRSGGATVIVLGAQRSPSPGRALEAFRRAGVRRIDLLVAADPPPRLLRALRHRWSVGQVLDPLKPVEVTVGGLRVEVDPWPSAGLSSGGVVVTAAGR